MQKRVLGNVRGLLLPLLGTLCVKCVGNDYSLGRMEGGKGGETFPEGGAGGPTGGATAGGGRAGPDNGGASGHAGAPQTGGIWNGNEGGSGGENVQGGTSGDGGTAGAGGGDPDGGAGGKGDPVVVGITLGRIYAAEDRYIAFASRARRLYLLTSDDGKSWTPSYSDDGSFVIAAAFGSGQWMVVGGSELDVPIADRRCRVLFSNDGRSFAAGPSPAVNQCESVVWTGSEFLTRGRDQLVRGSYLPGDNALSLWSYSALGGWVRLLAQPDSLVPAGEIAVGTDRLVSFTGEGAGRVGQMLHSEDAGRTWVASQSDVRTPQAVWAEGSGFGGKALSFPDAAGEPFPPGELALHSDDGVDWFTSSSAVKPDAVAHRGEQWIALAGSHTIYSRNGLQEPWTASPDAFDEAPTAIAAGETFVAGSQQFIWWSADGVRWTKATLPTLAE